MKAAHPEVVAATRVNPGETLRQARESNGWTLAEVALKLNLTSSSLSNLEAGAFDKLPGHTFARGYIRAYAKLLGMDQTLLVQQFDQCTGTDSQGSNVHALGRIEEPVRVSHTILRIVSLLLLIAVIGGGFVWWQDQTSQRTKDQAAISMEHVEVESADGTAEPATETPANAQAPAAPAVVPVPHAAQSLVVAPPPAPSPVSPVSPSAPVNGAAGAPAAESSAPVAGAQAQGRFARSEWQAAVRGASGLRQGRTDYLQRSGGRCRTVHQRRDCSPEARSISHARRIPNQASRIA